MNSRSELHQLDLFGMSSLSSHKEEVKQEKVEPCAENNWLGIDDLETLRPRIMACRRCPLRKGAKRVVFGEGNPRAHVLFIGEGPGQVEDETGRPFVGRAGKLLDDLLSSISIKREDVFIANIVKCRPPGNRIPLPEEVQACAGNLKAQIRIIKPKVVVLLGATASRNIIDDKIRVTRDRGRWIKKDGVEYLITLHPAAVLRNMGNKKYVLADFQSLRERLNGHVR